MVLSMDRWLGKVAVITGAGGGIGQAIVKKLVQEGLHVVGIDRRSDPLNETSKLVQDIKTGKFYSFEADVTQEVEIAKLFTKITEEIGPVHVLVNAAGLLQRTSLCDGDVDKWRRVLDVNVIGLSIMTKEAIKVMREYKIDGHICHICSIVGHMVPNIKDRNMYPVSKHAVRALAEALRHEMNNLGLKIKITNVSPGLVDTPIYTNNDCDPIGPHLPMLKPSDIADAICYTLATPPHVQVHELMIRPVGEMI